MTGKLFVDKDKKKSEGDDQGSVPVASLCPDCLPWDEVVIVIRVISVLLGFGVVVFSFFSFFFFFFFFFSGGVFFFFFFFFFLSFFSAVREVFDPFSVFCLFVF